jgi:hypothetical protein
MSPETAPPDVMLAEVFEFRSLDDQLVDLLVHREFVVRFEVSAGKLLRDTVKYLNCSCVLYLGHLVRAIAVCHAAWCGRRGIGTRATAGTRRRTHHAVRPCVGLSG